MNNTEPLVVPNTPGRDARGRYQPGHPLTVANGLRAVNLPRELAHLRAEVAEFEAACLVDEGDDEVPVRRRALLMYRARLHRRILQLDDALELRGLLDRRGKLRDRWLQQ